MDLAPPLTKLLSDLARMTASTPKPFITMFFGNPYVPMFLPDLPGGHADLRLLRSGGSLRGACARRRGADYRATAHLAAGAVRGRAWARAIGTTGGTGGRGHMCGKLLIPILLFAASATQAQRPADLTGTWVGSGTLTNNWTDPDNRKISLRCAYTGKLEPPSVTLSIEATSGAGRLMVTMPAPSRSCPALRKDFQIRAIASGTRMTFTDPAGDRWDLMLTDDLLSVPGPSVHQAGQQSQHRGRCRGRTVELVTRARLIPFSMERELQTSCVDSPTTQEDTWKCPLVCHEPGRVWSVNSMSAIQAVRGLRRLAGAVAGRK